MCIYLCRVGLSTTTTKGCVCLFIWFGSWVGRKEEVEYVGSVAQSGLAQSGLGMLNRVDLKHVEFATFVCMYMCM
jgi:hypothetical protein